MYALVVVRLGMLVPRQDGRRMVPWPSHRRWQGTVQAAFASALDRCAMGACAGPQSRANAPYRFVLCLTVQH